MREGRRRRRLAALYVALVSWTPIVLLAAAQGLAIGRSVENARCRMLPFLPLLATLVPRDEVLKLMLKMVI